MLATGFTHHAVGAVLPLIPSPSLTCSLDRYYLIPDVLGFVSNGQLLSESCGAGAPHYTRGARSHCLMLFGLSKVPEMLDTVFLVLRKRPVILLHW